MDTSRIAGVKASLHNGTPRSCLVDYCLRLVFAEERLLAVGNEVGAVVLDHLDGGGPARSFRFDARLGLVELHGLDVGRYLPFTDHADRAASSVGPSALKLQCAARRSSDA